MKMDFSKLMIFAFAGIAMACSQKVNFDLPATDDSFVQDITYNNKVDILWIVDNSTSMAVHQTNLSNQIPDLVAKLSALKMDFQMAVVTTSMGGTSPDGGRFIGTPKYLTNTTPDLVNKMKSRLLVGQAGSDLERGLESMQTALSPSYLANEGKGFLRNDALLVIIALSDEDDKSAVSNPSAHYTAFLDGLKKPWVDGSRSWIFNFIGRLPTSTNCNQYTQFSEVGYDFLDLVAVSKGVKESICANNFSNALTNIRARIFEILTDFPLKSQPLVDTIVVRVNGEIIPRSNTNGWDYIAETNIIRFYGSAVPAADASIKVDFVPAVAN